MAVLQRSGPGCCGRSEIPTTGKVVWCKGPEEGHFTIGIKIEVTGTEARAILARFMATL